MKEQLIHEGNISKKDIARRREVLKNIILEVRADPVLQKQIKKFIEMCQ